MPESGRFLRENAFLVAAVALPLLVVAVFLMASAVPRWRVPPPAYDLLLRTDGAYRPGAAPVAVDFRVRDGRLEATVRGLPATAAAAPPRLLLVDHETLSVRDVPLDLPSDLTEHDSPVTLRVAALEGRRIIAESKAPDGYEMRSYQRGGSGLIGDLFGGRSYDALTLVNRGRAVRVPLPSGSYAYAVSAIGWAEDP